MIGDEGTAAGDLGREGQEAASGTAEPTGPDRSPGAGTGDSPGVVGPAGDRAERTIPPGSPQAVQAGEQFRLAYPFAYIVVITTTSQSALSAVQDGGADIGLSDVSVAAFRGVDG